MLDFWGTLTSVYIKGSSKVPSGSGSGKGIEAKHPSGIIHHFPQLCLQESTLTSVVCTYGTIKDYFKITKIGKKFVGEFWSTFLPKNMPRKALVIRHYLSIQDVLQR